MDAHDLAHAIREGDFDGLRAGLNAGVDPSAVVSSEDHTLLHTAVIWASRQAVDILIEHGADVSAIDGHNATPRHLAEETAEHARANGDPEGAARMDGIAAAIKEAEIRQKYDIPRRSKREIMTGEDDHGRILFGLAWEGEQERAAEREAEGRGSG